jgi:hypothetical protein
MEIVYWFADGSNSEYCVFFAPRERAEYVSKIYEAMRDSATWGELRRNLPKGEWEAYFEECLEDSPDDDDDFDADEVPGHVDGDYPPWLAQEQLDWFPPELIAKYDGDVGSSVLNGPSLNLPADSAEAIADDLRALGHEVDETDLEFDC